MLIDVQTKLGEGVLDKIIGVAEQWALFLNETKPINPVNVPYTWAMPTDALIYVEQTSPRVEVDITGQYSIYAMFDVSSVDEIAMGKSGLVTYLSNINGRLCVLIDRVGWIQLDSIKLGGRRPDLAAQSLHSIRSRLVGLDNTNRAPTTVILDLNDVTNTLDFRQIKRNGFAECYADILQIADILPVAGVVDVPLLDSNMKLIEGKTVQAEILMSTFKDTAMVTVDLPAGVGLFMSDAKYDFPLQILEKHPVTGAIRSRTMSYWHGKVSALQFNWRCPIVATLMLKV